MSTKTVSDQILALASRPEGVSTGQAAGIPRKAAQARCYELLAAGKLFRAGTSRGYRYFTDPEAAKAYDSKPSTLPTLPLPKLNAGFAKDAKVVITSDTKVTICPTPAPRFEARALPGVIGANQRGRVA